MPRIETIEPGAIWAASPPPDIVAPLVDATICAAVELDAAVTVTAMVVSLPALPESREVNRIARIAGFGVAYTLVSPVPLLAALIEVASDPMMPSSVSVLVTVYL